MPIWLKYIGAICLAASLGAIPGYLAGLNQSSNHPGDRKLRLFVVGLMVVGAVLTPFGMAFMFLG